MLLSQRQYAVLNGLAFQVSWPVCVLGGSAIAVAATIAFLSFHLILVQDRRTESIFLLCAGAIGFVFDLALLQVGLLESTATIQPLWMICLWFLFATTVGYAMRWFDEHIVVAGVFAGIFAPLSYSVGAGLTDIDLLYPAWLTLVLIGCAWATVLPGFLLLRRSIAGRIAPQNRKGILS